ncbi:MAG: hypothetical protein QXP39_01020 [Candidatus Aenigmatarchaeota archaeon]
MFGLAGLIIGILLIIFGLYMIFFFPSTIEHQAEFSWRGVLLGVIALVIGALLIFI